MMEAGRIEACLLAGLSCFLFSSTLIVCGISGSEVNAALTGRPLFLHAALATNLAARAEVFNAKLLQLNVTWLPPTKGARFPKNYNLIVTSLAKPEELYCRPNETEYRLVETGTASSSTIPQLLNPTVHGEMRIKAGCTYKIDLFSNPHDGERAATINYTVPDCVRNICDCSPFTLLDRPQVLSANQMPSRVLNVTWSYPVTNQRAATVNITNFVIGLSQSTDNRSFFGMTPIGKHGYRDYVGEKSRELSQGVESSERLYTKLIALNNSLNVNMFYRIDVTVEDNTRSCHGIPGNIVLEVLKPVPSLGVNTRSSDTNMGNSELLVTVLPSVTFVLAVFLAIAMIWQRCGGWFRRECCKGHNQPIRTWQGEYKSVGNEASRVRASHPSMQSNVIYVEKEIEDAKARGEADMYEVSYERLTLGREIGKGAFGRVFLARAESIAGVPGCRQVAVKKLKQKAKADEVEEFLSEIAMLKLVGRNPNIVTMLGCVTIKPPYCMVMEYVPCGDLLQYLRRLRVEYELKTGALLQTLSTMTRPKSPRYIDLVCSDSDSTYVQPESQRLSLPSSGRPSITETEWSLLSGDSSAPLTPTAHGHQRHLEYILDPKELQNFAVQIARGMSHLERIQVTHRDLAARNVLIDENKILKISDFGLSRSGIYVNTKGKKLPLRWLSVEAIRDNLYSSKSDVWAFAIVLWEIGTLGGFPYPTIADYDLVHFLLDGKRLDKPDNCTDELYSLMLTCWSHAADMRPSFADLVSHLDSVICRRRVYVDFSNLRPEYTFPPTEQQTVKKEEASQSSN